MCAEVSNEEIRTAINEIGRADDQAFRIVYHIVRNPRRTIMINGVPGMGKTTIARSLAYLYGMHQTKQTTFSKFQVNVMTKYGLKDSTTLHSLCYNSLMLHLRKTKIMPVLSKDDLLRRDGERTK